MSSQTLIAGLPPDEELAVGCRIVLEMIDATTGAAVTGVTVANWTIRGDGHAGAGQGVFESLNPVLVVKV